MKRKKVLPLPASYTDEEHIDAELTNNHLVPSFHSSPPSTEAPVPELTVPEAKPKVKTRFDDKPSEFDVIDKDFINLSGEPVKLDVTPEAGQLPTGCTQSEVVINDAVSSAIEVDASVTEDVFLVPSIPPEMKEETATTTTPSPTSPTSLTSPTSPTSPSSPSSLSSPSSTAITAAVGCSQPPAEELRSPLPSPISLQNVAHPTGDNNELPVTKMEEEEEEAEEAEQVATTPAATPPTIEGTEEETKVQPSPTEKSLIPDVPLSVDVEQPIKMNCVIKEEPVNHFISGI